MGLDMYLNAERFVSGYVVEGDDERAEKIKELFPELASGVIRKVSAEVGYWRKANAIHNWFVQNVQNGVDDCGTYYVERKKLQELLNLVDLVLSKKGKRKTIAKAVLPPTSGFFFGGTDIDEYYYEDMKNTKTILENALKLQDNLDLYYHSSW